MSAIILDGPIGTELARRGIETPLPGWSAHALETHPEAVRQIHADYVAAGANVQTANTFRTKSRVFPEDWEGLTQLAVKLCREAGAKRIAGSLAPLEDCYRPDLSPQDPRPEHRAFAECLRDAGCDLILCETFPHVGEGLIAVEEAVRTGLETWAAFTAGPDANLMTPEALRAAAQGARERGATAVLINCTPVARTIEYVEALADCGLPFGAYGNAGEAEEGFGWRAHPSEPEAYADVAQTWVNAGATILGACCGTGPGHVAALAKRFG